MKNKIMMLILSLCVTSVWADEPVYNQEWQTNNNVSIELIYGFWNNDIVHLRLDNGQFCYIKASDIELLTVAIAMRSQGTKGQVVCVRGADKSVEGSDSRRIHRIVY